MHEDLLTIVTITCLEKVRSRVIKFRQEIMKIGAFTVSQSINPKTKTLAQILPEWKLLSDQVIILSFLCQIRNLDVASAALRQNPIAIGFYHR